VGRDEALASAPALSCMAMAATPEQIWALHAVPVDQFIASQSP
jgi:hypothetical protein